MWDRDHADRALRLDGPQALAHLGLLQAEAVGERRLDRDEIAILGAVLVAGENDEFTSLRLLVDGHDASAAIAILRSAEDAEKLVLLLGEQLDEAPAIGGIALARLLDAQQYAIAQSRRGAIELAPRHMDEDARRRPELLRIPIHRDGKKLAIGIARRDVCGGDGGQATGPRQRLAVAGDEAFALQILDHAFQFDTARRIDAEGAR